MLIMKNLKKFNVAILAVVLGLGMVISQSAFTAPTKKASVRYWAFDSTYLTDAKDAESYTLMPIDFNPENDIICSGNTLPCVLEVDDSIVSRINLASHLSTFANGAAVTASTPYQKN